MSLGRWDIKYSVLEFMIVMKIVNEDGKLTLIEVQGISQNKKTREEAQRKSEERLFDRAL